MHVDGFSGENSFDILRSIEENAFFGGEVTGDADHEEVAKLGTREALCASDERPRARARAGKVFGVPVTVC